MLHIMNGAELMRWALEHISDPIKEISTKDGTVNVYLCDGRVGFIYVGEDGPQAALPT